MEGGGLPTEPSCWHYFFYVAFATTICLNRKSPYTFSWVVFFSPHSSFLVWMVLLEQNKRKPLGFTRWAIIDISTQKCESFADFVFCLFVLSWFNLTRAIFTYMKYNMYTASITKKTTTFCIDRLFWKECACFCFCDHCCTYLDFYLVNIKLH